MTLLVPTSGRGLETGIGRYCAEVLKVYERLGVRVGRRPLRHHLFSLGQREMGYYVKFLLYFAKFRFLHRASSRDDAVHTFNPMIVPPETAVVTVWDLIPFDPALRRVQRRPPLYPFVSMLAERNLLDYPEMYVTISEEVRKEMREYFDLPAEQIRVARPSVDLDLFRPIASPDIRFGSDKLNVLHVGTALPRKNIMGTVEALGLLGPDRFRLVRVGPLTDPDYVEQYTRRAREIGLEVREVGYVSDEQLPSYYSAVDLVVFPSIAEGAGIPPVEAMACGTNVVVSDLPVHREMCGRAAFYSGTDAGSIAKAIEKAISHWMAPSELRAHASSWTWDDVARVYLDVYAELGLAV